MGRARAISPGNRVGARDRDRNAKLVTTRRGGVGDLATRPAGGVERPSATGQAIKVASASIACAVRPDDRVGARDRDRVTEVVATGRERGGIVAPAASRPGARDEAIEVGGTFVVRAEGPDDRVGARDRDRVAEVVTTRHGGVVDSATWGPGARDETKEVGGTFIAVRCECPGDRVGARDRDRYSEIRRA